MANRGEKEDFNDILMYDKVILPSLFSIGYHPEDILEYEDKEYINTYNPLIVDNNSRSCMIFKNSGMLKLLNGNITIEDNSYTTATITTWLRQTNIKLYFYIDFIYRIKLNLSLGVMIKYKDYIEYKLLNIPQEPNGYFEKIRKKLYDFYILDIDVLNISNFDRLNLSKFYSVGKKIKKTETRMDIVDPTEAELLTIKQYVEKRGLKLPISKNVVYKTVVQNDIYRKPSLCFAYEDGFFKYRIIFEEKKEYRFRSRGSYQNFFVVRQEHKTNTVYLVEGEIEGISISYFIEDDILCLHNTNSLPRKLNLLSSYDRIIVKIDYDRYEQNKNGFKKLQEEFPHKQIYIDYKINQDEEDYNTFLVENKLTKKIIETINILSEEEDMSQQLKIETKLDELDTVLQQTYEQNIENLEKCISDTNEKINSAKNILKNIRQEEISNLINSIKKANKINYEDEISQLKKQIENTLLQLEESNNKNTTLQKQIEELTKTLIPIEQQYATIVSLIPQKIKDHAIFSQIDQAIKGGLK